MWGENARKSGFYSYFILLYPTIILYLELWEGERRMTKTPENQGFIFTLLYYNFLFGNMGRGESRDA